MRGAICQFNDRTTSFNVCCEASQGFAAVDKAIERAPTLVILDLSLPMLDGRRDASALRRMIPSIKVIGLATFSAEELRTTLISAGFDMIVSKHEGSRNWRRRSTRLVPATDPLDS